MDGNFRAYGYVRSSGRFVEILDQPVGQFEETSGLPDRDRLTYTNGFYGWCAAVFVDMRDSSGLTRKYKRPRLAKLYRAFISELVAVLNSDSGVREVNIVSDCVWAAYSTPYQSDIDDVFAIAFQANTLAKLLNAHLTNREYESINVDIGIDYGRVLMIKAGFNGSGINDVVYMDDVINHAAHLAHKAGRGWHVPIWVGATFQSNLNDHNKSLLTQGWDSEVGSVYTGHVLHVSMNEWVTDQFG